MVALTEIGWRLTANLFGNIFRGDCRGLIVRRVDSRPGDSQLQWCCGVFYTDSPQRIRYHINLYGNFIGYWTVTAIQCDTQVSIRPYNTRIKADNSVLCGSIDASGVSGSSGGDLSTPPIRADMTHSQKYSHIRDSIPRKIP